MTDRRHLYIETAANTAVAKAEKFLQFWENLKIWQRTSCNYKCNFSKYQVSLLTEVLIFQLLLNYFINVRLSQLAKMLYGQLNGLINWYKQISISLNIICLK